MRSRPSGAASTHTTVIGCGRAPLDQQPARVLERAAGGQHRVEDEDGRARRGGRAAWPGRGGARRSPRCGPGPTKPDLGLRDQAQRGGHEAHAGAQDRHEHRRRRRSRLPVAGPSGVVTSIVVGGQVAGGLVDEHAGQAVEGLAELGVGRGDCPGGW